MPRYKDTERERVTGETRQLLLDAATEEFAAVGYADANINRISRGAGFAKGTIYNYFSSKRALMRAVIDAVSEQHLDLVVRAVEQEDRADRRLARFFETALSFVSQHFAPARVMVNTVYGPDDEFRLYAYQAYQPMFEFVARDIVGLGMGQGLFRELEPEGASRLLMTIYLVTASHVHEDGRVWLGPEQVIDFMLRALQA
jgi:AcrR family transcriptional regulator